MASLFCSIVFIVKLTVKKIYKQAMTSCFSFSKSKCAAKTNSKRLFSAIFGDKFSRLLAGSSMLFKFLAKVVSAFL